MLGYEIFFTSNASNVLYAYWGHDLGGHQGGNNDPELLLRWLQFGAYTPIFRTHATNDSKLERRIWKYSNFERSVCAIVSSRICIRRQGKPTIQASA